MEETQIEEGIAPSKKHFKPNKKRKIIVAILLILVFSLLINHCYCAWRSDSRAIKDYLRGKEKSTIINPYTGSYDIFFFDNHGHGFGYNNISFALYSQFNDQFVDQQTHEKDLLYIEVWIVFLNWGKLGDKDTTADVSVRNTEHGSEIAHARYKIKKTGKEIKTNTDYVYVGLAYMYMDQDRLEQKGHIWAWDLINKTNTYCRGHSNWGGWELPPVYNR